MVIKLIQKIPLDVLLILIGFGVRHFLPTIATGKESQNLLKYLKSRELTKEQQAELATNLAQTQLWIELHEQSCPYVKKKFLTQENNLKN